MSPEHVARPTKSQLRRAGSVIRKHQRGEAGAEEFLNALALVRAYRAEFANPLKKLNSGLRGITTRAGIAADVTQRLKREPTIIEKLAERETGLDLSRMQDIGGCRVVVEDIHDLRTTQSEIHRLWQVEITMVRDYVASPRRSGYRAVHIVLLRKGLPLEVQLRTTWMHDWAELVENISGELGINFKQDGDSAIHNALADLSQLHQAAAGGASITQEIADRLREQIRAERTGQSSPDESL